MKKKQKCLNCGGGARSGLCYKCRQDGWVWERCQECEKIIIEQLPCLIWPGWEFRCDVCGSKNCIWNCPFFCEACRYGDHSYKEEVKGRC